MAENIELKRVRAELKYFRISPKKIRPLIRKLVGKNPPEALALINILPQKAGIWLKKIIKSAVANAENKGLDHNKLIIKEFICNQGPKMKRFRPGPRGRAMTYARKLSHLKIILEEIETKESLKKEKIKVEKKKVKESKPKLKK